jgi:FTR1 family protein
MLEALIITLREGIEAALVVGIILTYLGRTGRAGLARWVYAGLGAGIAVSLLGAALVSALGIDEEAYEGWLLLIGGLFITTMVIWMLRAAKGLKKEIEGRVEAIAVKSAAGVAAGLFALTFVLVLREGIETVLFLAAVSLTTEAVLTFVGGLAGLALATLFGVSFVRGTSRIDLGRFFKVTAIVLLLLALQLFVGSLHEFGERGTIPIGRDAMRVIGPIVKRDVIVLASILSIPLFALLIPGRASARRVEEAGALAGPERRLALARIRRERRWRTLLASAGILIVASLGLSFALTRPPAAIDPPSILGADTDGLVRLPKAGLEDGHLHRFGVSIDGTVVRFFVMKSGARLVPAFDACIVCGAYGYAETKGRLVCLACAADINPSTLGVPGGCNPIPLTHVDSGSEITIRSEDLRAELDAFRAAEGTVSAPPVR